MKPGPSFNVSYTILVTSKTRTKRGTEHTLGLTKTNPSRNGHQTQPPRNQLRLPFTQNIYEQNARQKMVLLDIIQTMKAQSSIRVMWIRAITVRQYIDYSHLYI